MAKTFDKLLIQELEDLFNTEKEINHFFPILEHEVHTDNLKKLLTDCTEETKKQMQRLETALTTFKKTPKNNPCKAIIGLIDDAKAISKNFKEKSTLKDAALIGVIQKIKHYEISSYSTAISYAKLLELDDLVTAMQESLEEESATNLVLCKIAEGTFYAGGVYTKAMKTKEGAEG